MNYNVILFLLVCSQVIAQVGIGTTAPTETLDVNGTTKIRNIPTTSNLSQSKDMILSSDAGVISSITSTELIAAGLPSAIKGNFSSGGTFSLSLVSGESILTFDNLDFDANNEFNTTTHSFTATQAGIYQITLQIELTSLLGVSSDIGIRIKKNGTTVQENRFANISLLGTNVSPPIRTLSTLLQLDAGDEVSFHLVGGVALASLDIDGSSAKSYFTILQVR